MTSSEPDIQYIANEQHYKYKEVIARFARVKHTLWIGTAV